MRTAVEKGTVTDGGDGEGVVDGKGKGYISKTTWRILHESELIGPVMSIYLYVCVEMMGRRNIRRAVRV